MNLYSKSIGLALSGGGTKGLAHAGAIKFLEEQNIRPTKIAGTSAGSIVGALYAWGKTSRCLKHLWNCTLNKLAKIHLLIYINIQS